MNGFLRKYLLLFFLIANLTAEYYIFSSVSKYLFYISLAIGLVCCVIYLGKIHKAWKATPCFLFWFLIYMAYQFTVGQVHMTMDNILYLIAKIVSFGIMGVCIASAPNFYLRYMSRPIGLLIVFLLLIGFSYISYGDSRSFGFFNGNAGCAVAMYGTSCFLFQEKLSKIDKIGLLFCLLCVLIGHSRNALAMLFVIIIFRYQFSLELLLVGLLGAVVVFIVLPSLGFETESFSRLLGTIDGTVEIDREDNRNFAMNMIKTHPIDGFGFNYDDYMIKKDMPSSHNGYLSVLVQMGCVFGGAWLLVLLWSILSVLKNATSKDLAYRRHVAVIVAILFGTMNESYLTGVNQITTNLFFVSLITIHYNAKLKNRTIRCRIKS